MLFNSISFLIFFPIVTAGYFLLPHRWRWLWLLLASCYFYMAFIPIYILILIFTIIVDYIAGILIENAQGNRRRWLLSMSIVANVGILAVFKYYNFFNVNLANLAHFLHWNYSIPNLSIILPIGLSFHTFQAMSYTIEVYRGKQKAERHFGIYALYVMFYPQLVAGPIERPQNLLPQFHQEHDFDPQRIVAGLQQILWGFIKKVIIADRLAIYVNQVYSDPNNYQGTPVVLATYFFAFQIFCDFSGYSDIALGTAKVMGIKLMQNFDRPYSSRSISEFWLRWHISLSTWFRDYLYIPLGGNRVDDLRWYRNLLTVFLVSGFWHGANWTFLLWGALHGFYLITAIITQPLRKKITTALHLINYPRLHNIVKILITFHLTLFAWIFFRANSVTDGFTIINNMTLIDSSEKGIYLISKNDLYISIISIIFLEVVHYFQNSYKIGEIIAQKPLVIRWGIYYLAIIAILLLGKFKELQFIYFQF